MITIRMKIRNCFILAAVSLILLLTGAFPSFAGETEAGQKAEEQEDKAALSAMDFSTEPHTKEDGSSYVFAYLDYDEYLPASRQFYYILKGLEELGWIRAGSLSITADDIVRDNLTTRDIYEKLLESDLGPYMDFAGDGFFYLAYDDPEAIAETLREKAGSEIDAVITFGTSAGVFARNLDLPVPMVDFSATDPVASGIIDSSTEGSGNPNVWAQVEPDFLYRQLRYYHSLQPFKKLGIIIYGDETISGVPDIMKASEDFGFKVVKYNIDEQPRETAKQLENYYALVGEEIEKMAGEDIDAFYLTVDLINDLSLMEDLLEPFYEHDIPVYLMDDVEGVKNGCLMLIAANDLDNLGRFIADAIARILNGAQAGSLPCVYSSAPSIYVNYDVAMRIGYPLSFDFLVACDEIFSKKTEAD